MEEKKDFYQVIEEIYAVDPRYHADSYEFLMQGLHFTQNKLKKNGHLSGKELTAGLRDFAVELYGPLAKTVLNYWGIHQTKDFGNIVFNLIDKKILFKTEEDSLEDFHAVYDFDSAFADILLNANFGK
jgi:uncharacterized repeat protein (TIGR04138 family)